MQIFLVDQSKNENNEHRFIFVLKGINNTRTYKLESYGLYIFLNAGFCCSAILDGVLQSGTFCFLILAKTLKKLQNSFALFF